MTTDVDIGHLGTLLPRRAPRNRLCRGGTLWIRRISDRILHQAERGTFISGLYINQITRFGLLHQLLIEAVLGPEAFR